MAIDEKRWLTRGQALSEVYHYSRDQICSFLKKKPKLFEKVGDRAVKKLGGRLIAEQ